ncbi:MAG: AraC family transcriptional regulator [Candidatus Izemoplasma sp.]
MKKEINRILEYIEDNICEDLSLAILSEQLHYSNPYISRMFNKYVGLSLNDYINRRRLSLAAIAIKSERKSIFYLANHYGFNSQKYFSNLFKKTFGIAPLRYRKSNMFITLQPKRFIKGELNMVINSVKDVCIELSKNVDNENSLFDKVSEISNIQLFSMKDSDIQLIGYFSSIEESYIYEISLNLMNGIFVQKTIFIINKVKHVIKSLDKDDEGIFVIIEDKKTNKQIKAVFNQGSQPKVIMHTDIKNDLRVYGKYCSKQEYDMLMTVIGNLKDRIKKQNNSVEIFELVKKEEDLVLLRHFGSEFVFVKLLKDKEYFQLESIYADMNNNLIESYSFFSSYVKAKNIEMRKEGLSIAVYCDNTIYGKSYIYGGDEVTSSIFIKLPSGMSGTGGWDISPKYK